MTEIDYPSQPVTVDDIVRLCDLAINCFASYQEKIDPALFTSGSPASVAADAAKHEQGQTEEWSDELIKGVTHRALNYLAINTQHTAAIRALIEAGIFGLPVGAPVRSMVEASARVAWLLDKRLSPAGDVRRRVARYVLDVDEDVTRFANIARGFQHPERRAISKIARKAHSRIKTATLFYKEELRKTNLRDNIRSEFEKDEELSRLLPADSREEILDRVSRIASEVADPTNRTTRFLSGEDMTTPVRSVKDAADMFHPGRPAVDATYSYLSGMSHPSIEAFRESLDLDRLKDEDGPIGVRQDIEFTAKLVLHGLQCFCDAWRLYASWTGTSLHDVHELIDALNLVQMKIPEDDADANRE